MSYISRLIKRAVCEEREDYQIGKYSITPQHGNVHVYNIYKKTCHVSYVNHKDHIATVTIDREVLSAEDVELRMFKDASSKEYKDLEKELMSIYQTILVVKEDGFKMIVTR